jgi:hypothetical protein
MAEKFVLSLLVDRMIDEVKTSSADSGIRRMIAAD